MAAWTAIVSSAVKGFVSALLGPLVALWKNRRARKDGANELQVDQAKKRYRQQREMDEAGAQPIPRGDGLLARMRARTRLKERAAARARRKRGGD